MKHRIHDQQEESAQDSFLDVVANLVGVIIILVMLVGTKTAHDVMRGKAPAASPIPADLSSAPSDPNLAQRVVQARSKALATNRDVEKMVVQLARLSRETNAFDDRRVELVMHRQLVEEDLKRRRQLLDTDQQQHYDVQRSIAASQLELDRLMKDRLSLLAAPETVEELESLPTPIAREVDEESIHLRLKHGLISVVPLERLIDQVELHVEDFRRRLQLSGEVVDTFGPIDGYRIRMTVSRVLEANGLGGPRAGQRQRVSYDQFAEIIPVSANLGQDVEAALAPGGTIHQYLQDHRRRSPAVVVWLYTDSFKDFRLLKRTLWEMGYSFATRPLEPGQSIGLSPHGTKAAAQ